MSCAKTNLPLYIDHLLPREKGMEMVYCRKQVQVVRAHFSKYSPKGWWFRGLIWRRWGECLISGRYERFGFGTTFD